MENKREAFKGQIMVDPEVEVGENSEVSFYDKVIYPESFDAFVASDEDKNAIKSPVVLNGKEIYI